ncbi:adenylate/guanylate cyclase domain-containing protein [Georgenia subflava]|uniref:Adenylate/guanylate cyclase domain-containing protein n=1 Tax=Georgenia subflava TaxID=1622177 RepID=A0A6N7EJH1_9MICO|nr:adenylate/guanylate cyclase domain-containing protein [Georgenia subflava]MPV38542.1 adenylate/guanylate cyclase domain-containing protein [Georgenia subflava]
MRSGEVDIAYQVVGAGQRDVVVGIGWVSHLELLWELPESVHFLERLAGLGRLILYDARGTGLSDRPGGAPEVHDLVPDLVAVLDAAGSTRAVVVGWLDKAALALALAATHPERVEALVLGEPMASTVARPGHPDGLEPAVLETLASAVESGSWGTGALLPWIAPSVADEPRIAAWWRRWERMSATPNTAAGLLRLLLDVDVRALLPRVRARTLLIHRAGTALVPAAAVRWLADALPDARYTELEGTDLAAFFGDTDTLMDEIEDFVSGTRTGADVDRALATMLVTDLVGSTAQAAALGDRRWRELLDWHHQEVRRLLARYGGTEIDTAGDGFLAVFDLPSRAISCALALSDHLAGHRLGVRAGLHTGEVVRAGTAVRGVAVHVAARVAALGGAGEVLVSGTVRDLVLGSGVMLTPRGTHELHGVPGTWEVLEAARTGVRVPAVDGPVTR